MSTTTLFLPPGFRFRPTDNELVKEYLFKKILGQPLPFDQIQDCEIYGDRPPWELSAERHQDWLFDPAHEGVFYAFVRLKKLSPNRVSRSVSWGGEWRGSTTPHSILDAATGKTIAKKKQLNFRIKKVGEEGRTSFEKTDWLMDEYFLEEKTVIGKKGPDVDYVLCRIFKTPTKSNSSKRKREDDEEAQGVEANEDAFDPLNLHRLRRLRTDQESLTGFASSGPEVELMARPQSFQPMLEEPVGPLEMSSSLAQTMEEEQDLDSFCDGLTIDGFEDFVRDLDGLLNDSQDIGGEKIAAEPQKSCPSTSSEFVTLVDQQFVPSAPAKGPEEQTPSAAVSDSEEHIQYNDCSCVANSWRPFLKTPSQFNQVLWV